MHREVEVPYDLRPADCETAVDAKARAASNRLCEERAVLRLDPER